MTPAELRAKLEAFESLLEFIETLPPEDRMYVIHRDRSGVVRVQAGWRPSEAGVGEVEGILRGIEAAKKGLKKENTNAQST